MPYRELSSKNQIKEDQKGVTGTKSFVLDSGGSIPELPELGDIFDSEFPSLTLKTRTRTLFGGKPGLYEYTCDYSAENVDKADQKYEELTRNLDVSGELLNVGKVEYSEGLGQVVGESDAYKRIVTVSFKIPKVFKSWGTLLSKTRAAAGKINSTSFEGEAAGTVLFCGATSQQFLDKYGIKLWRAEFQFEVRNPGWNYVWQDRPVSDFKEAIPAIYESTDLKAIFTV